MCKTKYFRECSQVIPLSSILYWLFFYTSVSSDWKSKMGNLCLVCIYVDHCIQYSRNLIGKEVYCYLTLFLWVHKVRPPCFETELHSHNEAGALFLPLSFSLYYNVPCEIRTKRGKLAFKFLCYFKESCLVHLYPFRSMEEIKLLASYFVGRLYCLLQCKHNLIYVLISCYSSSEADL